MLPTRRGHLLRNTAATILLPVLAILLTAAVRSSEAFALHVYLPFSRRAAGLLGFLFSFSTYAVAEILLVMAAAAGLFFLVRSIVRAARERSGWPLLMWLSSFFLAVASVYFLFILLWGGCYHIPKLEKRLELHTVPQDESILVAAAMRHLEDVLVYSSLVPRDATGAVSAGGFDALAPEAANSVKALMAKAPDLFGSAIVTPPKRAASYKLLGMLGIGGIYVPFTGESVVNTVSTDPFLPSTMCHELAHRLGFAPEEDANLIAYLACMESEEPIFRYSGALMAYTYCYSAVTDPANKTVLWRRLNEGTADVLDDFSRDRVEWDQYDGPLREAAQNVNDAYLQSMGQEEGIRSYGRVADMLIALYLEEQTN